MDSTTACLAYPPIWADLAMYQAFGLNVVVPERTPDNDYWLEISPELVGTYAADLFFISTRTGVLTPDELKANAAYGRQSAIAAGQIGLWNQDFIQSYQGLTIAMNDLMDVPRNAKKVAG